MSQPNRQLQGCRNRLIIVGHGRSASRVPGAFVDACAVVRIRDIRLVGNRTDFVVARNKDDAWDGEWWEVTCPLLRRIESDYGFSAKPSMGTVACILARERFPESEMGVIGFDYNMNPDMPDKRATFGDAHWTHDCHAENRCLKELGIEDWGIYAD